MNQMPKLQKIRMSVYFALFRSQSEMIEINILLKIVVYLPPVAKVKVKARILDIAFLGKVIFLGGFIVWLLELRFKRDFHRISCS